MLTGPCHLSDAMEVTHDRALEDGVHSILSDFELWGDAHCTLSDRPNVLVKDFCLKHPGDLFGFEASDLVAAGRSLAQVHLDSVMAGHRTSYAAQSVFARLCWESFDLGCIIAIPSCKCQC